MGWKRKINLFILGFVGILISNNALAQKVEGTIVSDNEPLLQASVVILDQKDSTIVSFAITDENGYFKIPQLGSGNFILQVTYLGFEQYNNPFMVEEDNVVLGEINLSRSNNEIDGVEIKGDRIPLMVKKDTLIYSADAFQTQPNEVVEDLLRKMPGVEVESDGTIKAQGEDVEQVLVDGKRFFGDDPKIATKNLPASSVDKVQIYDKLSDKAEFSGVDDGERIKTINLELKEGHKNGYFGNIVAGYGTDDRYTGKMNLNRFNAQTQISFIGNFNNINEQGFSIRDYANFMGGFGGFRRDNAPISNGLSDGFVTTNAGGINLNHSFNEKLSISTNYFLNAIENDIDNIELRENFNEGQSFTSESLSSQISQSHNHRLNLEIEAKLDSFQDLRIRSGLVYNDGDVMTSNIFNSFNSTLLANKSSSNYASEGDNLTFNLNTVYRVNLGKSRNKTFTFEGRLNSAQNDFISEINSENILYDNDQTEIDNFILLQDAFDNDEGNDYRLELSYVEPLSFSSYLEFKLRRQNYNNDVVSEYFDLVNNESILNVDLSNAFNRHYVYDRLSSVWFHVTEKSQFSAEAAFQSSRLNGELILENQNIEKNVLRFLPRLNWRYDLGNGQNFRMRYSTSLNMPSLTQLQPSVDNSNPLAIYQGNPELKPEYSHRLRLNFMKFDQFTFQSFFAFLNFNYSKNSIQNATTIDRNFVQFTQPQNVDYNFSSNASIEFASPLPVKNLKFNIRQRIGFTDGFTFLNAEEVETNRFTGTTRLRFENRNKSNLDWRLGGSYTWSNNTFSSLEREDLSFNSKTLFGSLTYVHKEKFSIETGLDIDFYDEEQVRGDQTTVPILKASISAFILKDQRGEVKISAFDILNKNIGINQTQNLNYIETSETLSLSRYFLLSFNYRIKKS